MFSINRLIVTRVQSDPSGLNSENQQKMIMIHEPKIVYQNLIIHFFLSID